MTFPNTRLRPVAGTLLGPPARGLVGVVAVPAAYLGVLTVAAAGRRRSGRLVDTGGEGATRFALLVPAHDEARVIGATVAALVAQRYPTDRFSVHVVADNCSDDTAALARANGANVLERHDPHDPGKGPALNWLVESIGLEHVDAVVVVDADTLADTTMLAALDREFAAGAMVVQGDYGVLEPESSSAVALRFAALACRHHLRPLGRTRLGGSCGLYGNGMAFRSELMGRRAWSNHLVEDAEFQLELLLDGVAVTFCPDAALAAEMPSSLAGAVSQHQRWELGRAQLLRRFAPDLARAMLTGRGRNGRRGALPRRAYADALLDLVVPPLSLLVTLQLASIVVSGTSHALAPRRRSRRLFGASVLALGVTIADVLAALRLVGAPRSVWRALSSAPRLVLWKLGLLTGIARRPDSVSWQRTGRNADVVVTSGVAAPRLGRSPSTPVDVAGGCR